MKSIRKMTPEDANANEVLLISLNAHALPTAEEEMVMIISEVVVKEVLTNQDVSNASPKMKRTRSTSTTFPVIATKTI